MFTLTYTLESSCRMTYGEIVESANRYTIGYNNVIEFTDAFAFNFGLLYDSIITAYYSFEKGNWFMGGYSLGNILYLVFYI